MEQVRLYTTIARAPPLSPQDTGHGTSGWITDNLNQGKLYNFYWLLAALSVLNFAVYLYCAKCQPLRVIRIINSDSGENSSNILGLLGKAATDQQCDSVFPHFDQQHHCLPSAVATLLPPPPYHCPMSLLAALPTMSKPCLPSRLHACPALLVAAPPTLLNCTCPSLLVAAPTTLSKPRLPCSARCSTATGTLVRACPALLVAAPPPAHAQPSRWPGLGHSCHG
ncbi:NRT1-PTR FAMILY 6-3 protein [Nymphaea thermarum]|nr:NRT1-PTR FAMILY 6-3 protein [Nymphaea thermarum]